MSVDTRFGRAKVKLPPEQPAIPQRKPGSAGYWLYLVPGLLLLLVIIVIPLIWNTVLTFTKWRGVGIRSSSVSRTGRSSSLTRTSGHRSRTPSGWSSRW